MLAYQAPEYTNPKLVEWYNQGFEENEEINEIQQEVLSLGQSGEPLTIPIGYEIAKFHFDYYYEIGLTEYEKEQTQKQAAAGGLGLAFASWLSRRFYVAKKTIV